MLHIKAKGQKILTLLHIKAKGQKNPLPVQHWLKTAFCIGQPVLNNNKMQFSFTENEMRGQ